MIWLFKGMAVTIKHLFTKPITVQYPTERREPSPRWRGILAVRATRGGEPLCTACQICVKNCPDRLITVTRDPEAKAKAQTWEVFHGRCMYCGICVETCPFDAITFLQEYEFAYYDWHDTVMRLIDDGRAVEGRYEAVDPENETVPVPTPEILTMPKAAPAAPAQATPAPEAKPAEGGDAS